MLWRVALKLDGASVRKHWREMSGDVKSGIRDIQTSAVLQQTYTIEEEKNIREAIRGRRLNIYVEATFAFVIQCRGQMKYAVRYYFNHPFIAIAIIWPLQPDFCRLRRREVPYIFQTRSAGWGSKPDARLVNLPAFPLLAFFSSSRNGTCGKTEKDARTNTSRCRTADFGVKLKQLAFLRYITNHFSSDEKFSDLNFLFSVYR